MALTPIVLNGRFLAARPTGVQRVARQLVAHLDRLLSTSRSRPGRAWRLDFPGGETEPLPLENIVQRRCPGLTGQAWEQIALPHRASGAVLVNLCNLAPLVHRRSVTLIHDAQVFLTPESYSAAFVAWYRFALPKIGASAARVITVSDYSRDRLVAFGVAPNEKISVIHNGADHFRDVAADTGVLELLRLRPGRFVITVAGTLVHKNVGVLLKAFASPMLADLQLVIAGAEERQDFARAGLDVPRTATFTGRVSDCEMRALYENALCLAFPSKTEGFGLPPLEAMALGCPAIVAPCGALPEICGDAAIYADPDAPADWIGAIRRLADHADVREVHRKEGSVRAAAFRWETSARSLLAAIEDVATGFDARAARG